MNESSHLTNHRIFFSPPHVVFVSSAIPVLFKCRELRDELRNKKQSTQKRKRKDPPPSSILTLGHSLEEEGSKKHPSTPVVTSPVPSSTEIVEVADLGADKVLDVMESIAVRIANQVLSKKGLSMDIPSRAASNQVYVKEWDRIVLGNKRSTRSFLNVKESRKTAVTMRVFQLIHAVLVKRIHITKRDLFYTDVKLFVDQAESDGVLDDIATMVGCTRSKYVC